MKKFLSVIISLVMVFAISVPAFAASPEDNIPQSYALNIDGEVITFEEGEKVIIPLELTEEGKEILADSTGGVQPYGAVSFPGDAGVLTVWGEGTRFYWSIAMAVPATSFTGFVSGTDLTTGFSSGTAAVSGFSGSCAVGHSSGHQYGATISGTAFLLTVPVAKTVSNWIYWRA